MPLSREYGSSFSRSPKWFIRTPRPSLIVPVAIHPTNPEVVADQRCRGCRSSSSYYATGFVQSCASRLRGHENRSLDSPVPAMVVMVPDQNLLRRMRLLPGSAM